MDISSNRIKSFVIIAGKITSVELLVAILTEIITFKEIKNQDNFPGWLITSVVVIFILLLAVLSIYFVNEDSETVAVIMTTINKIKNQLMGDERDEERGEQTLIGIMKTISTDIKTQISKLDDIKGSLQNQSDPIKQIHEETVIKRRSQKPAAS